MEAQVTQNTLHVALLAQHEFRLVSFDMFGKPEPLPAGLGNLPLIPHDNGFYSVNGPLNLTVFSPRGAITPVNGGNHATIHPLVTGNINTFVTSPSKARTFLHLLSYTSL